MKNMEQKQLSNAGWSELWLDPHGGKLWSRKAAINILRSRGGASHVSTEDVRNCINYTCKCDERASQSE